MKYQAKTAIAILATISSSWAGAAAPAVVDLPVDLSSSGGKYCVSISPQCTSGWSFLQHKTGGHVKNGGVGGANDMYAWDVNLNSPSKDYDKGNPVRAIEAGTIYTGNGWGGTSFGQVLINHLTSSGQWSSGYLHMSGIAKKSGTVQKGEIIGYISNKSTANITNHLHFVVYNGYSAGTSSVDVRFSGVTARQPTPPVSPTLISPANSAINIPISNVKYSWNSSSGANNYRIVISQDSRFSGFVDSNENSYCNGTCYTTTTGGLTSFMKSMAMKNQTYYWKVRASGSGGTSAWSVTRSFRTANY